MLGLNSYGSDASDSDSEKPVAPTNPSVIKAKKPIRIAVSLPKAVHALEDDETDKPMKKRPRVEAAAGPGRSSLLSMLPAPKASSHESSKPQRVLGGAGSGSAFSIAPSLDVRITRELQDNPISLVPVSVKKAFESVKPKEGARDFFSLEPSGPNSRTTTPSSSSTAMHVSSAPEVEEFQPPEPTPLDPYPGYYQLPNGTWGQYDPTYYKTFCEKWQNEAISDKEEKGFEGVDTDNIQSFNAQDHMARARKEIEETKSLTRSFKSGPSAPNMNIAKAPARSLANQRHQLSTLLYSAYQNREALEERIAEGKRNRKEAGNKYGF